jgi:hypothetical protein
MLWENTDFIDAAVRSGSFASCISTITASVVGRIPVNRGIADRLRQIGPLVPQPPRRCEIRSVGVYRLKSCATLADAIFGRGMRGALRQPDKVTRLDLADLSSGCKHVFWCIISGLVRKLTINWTDIKDNRPMPFERGRSGNPAGGPVGSRHRQQLNGEFIAALLRDFRHGGPAAIAKVRKNQPAAYCKLLTLLCPRDVKVEHSGGVKAMSDEEIEQAIELIQTMLAARAGEAAEVIEGMAEPAALPAPNGQSSEAALEPAPSPKSKHKSNRLMLEADTALGPRERTPRKMRPPASE